MLVTGPGVASWQSAGGTPSLSSRQNAGETHPAAARPRTSNPGMCHKHHANDRRRSFARSIARGHACCKGRILCFSLGATLPAVLRRDAPVLAGDLPSQCPKFFLVPVIKGLNPVLNAYCQRGR